MTRDKTRMAVDSLLNALHIIRYDANIAFLRFDFKKAEELEKEAKRIERIITSLEGKCHF